MTNQPSLLIDASIYIFQYYFTMPDNWYSDTDYPTGAVYGYTTFLLRLLEEQRPKRIAACFDESLGSCFRNEIYSNYKISRPPADDALAFQLRACREITELFEISCFASKRYEADDLLGTLTKLLRRNKTPIAILTRDKDLGQLIRREQDYLWDYKNGEKMNHQGINTKFGVKPEQLIDYLALVGDSIDDIPGVPGVGPKTAQVLLAHFGNINNIFKGLDSIASLHIRGAKNLAQKLHDYSDQIQMAKQLTKIKDDIELGISSKELNWRPNSIEYDYLQEFCQRMGFPRLYTRMEKVFA